MKLGDLPIDIQKLAFQRAMEGVHPGCLNKNSNSETQLFDAFSWGDTPEGKEYWSKICYKSNPVTSNSLELNSGIYGETLKHTEKAPDMSTKFTHYLEEGSWKPYKKEPTTQEGDTKSEESKHKGLRFNLGKLRYDLVHPVAHEGMVKVLTRGAEKYAERNWENGMSWSSVVASLKRHLAAWEKGEDYDPETGELHINHIACNAHFLSAYYKIYPQGDDRPHNYLKNVKIGLDIDEVLCDWIGDWTTLRGMPHPNSWYFDRGLVSQFEKMKEEGTLEPFYMALKPLITPEDIPFEPHCYITSRPVDSSVTEAWLAKYGFPARPVYTTGVMETKVDIAKREGLDIFVDDGFHNFQALNNAGICCFLMDAPHNRRYDVGFKRITNLNQIV